MSIRPFFRFIFSFVIAGFVVSAVAAQNVDLSSKAAKLIMKVSKNQLQIINQFQTPAGMTGFVVKPIAGGKSMILYVDKSEKYLFMGNIISADGKSLSASYTEKYITVITAKTAYAALSTTHWFTQGSANAPHKIYVVIEPNCSACHFLYQVISPLIKKGQLQVRWIPVAFRLPDSAGKAANMLYPKTDKERVKQLQQDEKAFNMKDEEGGLKALPKNSKDKRVATVYQYVAENTKFFSKYFNATPVIIYKKTDKSPTFMMGAPRPNALNAFLAGVSGEW